MGGKGKVGVQSDSKDFRSFLSRDEGIINGDLGMNFGLVEV